MSFLRLNTYIINIPAVADALADGAARDVPVLTIAAADQAVANLCCCWGPVVGVALLSVASLL